MYPLCNEDLILCHVARLSHARHRRDSHRCRRRLRGSEQSIGAAKAIAARSCGRQRRRLGVILVEQACGLGPPLDDVLLAAEGDRHEYAADVPCKRAADENHGPLTPDRHARGNHQADAEHLDHQRAEVQRALHRCAIEKHRDLRQARSARQRRQQHHPRRGGQHQRCGDARRGKGTAGDVARVEVAVNQVEARVEHHRDEAHHRPRERARQRRQREHRRPHAQPRLIGAEGRRQPCPRAPAAPTARRGRGAEPACGRADARVDGGARAVRGPRRGVGALRAAACCG
mmetsp:Transcript_7712/g.23544  ORF Transcript_7712/g.23544 Transcript_7712/m.23544 type:complete len:287 (+) Transcript_7712:188-1048(+)